MGGAEEELPVEVGNFDVVVIGDTHASFGATPKTHACKAFNQLAAERSGSDHERSNFAEFFLDLLAVNADLVVVAAAHRLTVGFLGDRLQDVVVEPLTEWCVLSSVFDDLLGDNSSEESRLA